MAAVTIGLTTPEGPEGAPLVVLAHSLGTGPLVWEQTLPMLHRAGYRTSLLTLPGHGHVPVPHEPFSMDELADSVAAAVPSGGPVFFAGVSIGGALAFTLAIRHPEVFHGIVPIASKAAMGDAEHWGERARTVREQSTSALIADSASRWFAPSSLEREPEVCGRILHALRDTPDEGYARCAEALGTYDVGRDVERIRVPMLLLVGEQDQVAPTEDVTSLARRIPGARSAIIEDAGHQPPAEQAGRVFDLLDEFFREVLS